jgi:hypothetical protein
VLGARRPCGSYAADEGILGGTEFVESLRREQEKEEARRGRARRRELELPTRIHQVARMGGVTVEDLVGGGRRRDVCPARDGRVYLWSEVLGRSGRHLAREVGIRPEAVYQGARRGQSQRARCGHVVG